MTALDDAWQGALAAEHQAVFGYALAGVRLTGAQRTLAATSADAHAATRDALAAAIARHGLTPVAAQADYPALYPVPDAATALRLAARLEDSAASAWRYLYAQAVASHVAVAGTLRTQAQRELIECAVRATRWRVSAGATTAGTPFPGLPA